MNRFAAKVTVRVGTRKDIFNFEVEAEDVFKAKEAAHNVAYKRSSGSIASIEVRQAAGSKAAEPRVEAGGVIRNGKVWVVWMEENGHASPVCQAFFATREAAEDYCRELPGVDSNDAIEVLMDEHDLSITEHQVFGEEATS